MSVLDYFVLMAPLYILAFMWSFWIMHKYNKGERAVAKFFKRRIFRASEGGRITFDEWLQAKIPKLEGLLTEEVLSAFISRFCR